MRERNEIKQEFNNAMPERKEEFLEYRRQKLIMEVLLDIRELLKNILENK